MLDLTRIFFFIFLVHSRMQLVARLLIALKVSILLLPNIANAKSLEQQEIYQYIYKEIYELENCPAASAALFDGLNPNNMELLWSIGYLYLDKLSPPVGNSDYIKLKWALSLMLYASDWRHANFGEERSRDTLSAIARAIELDADTAAQSGSLLIRCLKETPSSALAQTCYTQFVGLGHLYDVNRMIELAHEIEPHSTCRTLSEKTKRNLITE